MHNDIRLLLIEDEPLILRQLETMLSAVSPRIVIVGRAHNGKEGLLLLQSTAPDVVITDIRMPIMTGLEMIAEAKAQGHHCQFWIFSGYSEFQYACSALQLGVK